MSLLLWDLTDNKNDKNIRAQCNKGCEDSLELNSYDIVNLVAGRKVKNIGDFYILLRSSIAPGVDSISPVHLPVDSWSLQRAHALGALFAEFGVAPSINERDHGSLFADLRSARPARPTIYWRQFNTGSMPGLDKFKLMVFNEAKTRKIYQANMPGATRAGAKEPFEYKLTQEQLNGLLEALKNAPTKKVYLMVEGVASGAGAGGGIGTGPYCSNLAEFSVPLFNKLAVIAVDSSGSNVHTDPLGLRKDAAQKILENMARRNNLIAAGKIKTGELPSRVGAIDFNWCRV